MAPQKTENQTHVSYAGRRFSLLIKNTMAVFTRTVFQQVLAFITMPLLIHHVGVSDYGIFTLATSTFSYFSVVGLSLRRSVVKYISEFGHREPETANQFFNTSLLVNLVVGIVVGGILLLLSVFCDVIFKIDGSEIWKAKTLLLMFGMATIFIQPLSVFRSVLLGFQNHTKVATLDAVGESLRALTILAIIFLDGSIFWLAWQIIIFAFIRSAVFLIFIRGHYPFLVIKPRIVKLAYVKKMALYSGWSMLYTLALITIYQGNLIIIGMVLSVSMITYFQIAYKLYNLINSVSLYLNTAVVPASSAAMADGDQAFLNRMITSGTKVNMSILLLLTSTMIIYSGPILEYWMGADFVEPCLTLTRLILFSWVFYAPMVLMTRVYWAQEDISRLSIISVLAAVIQLVLTVVLLKIIGLQGAAYATIIYFAILCVPGTLTILRKLKLNPSDFVFKTVLHVYAFILLFSILLWLSQRWIGRPADLLELVFYIMATLITGFCLCFGSILRGDAKTLLLKMRQYRVGAKIPEASS